MKVNLRACSRVALVLMAFCSSLAARDLNQDEALALRQQGVPFALAAVHGGKARNAIPAAAEAVLVSAAPAETLQRVLAGAG